MLVKASIAATVVICAMVSLSSIDFGELYNEMYPVNGLKRGVLGLCQQAKPTFVRAIESDRVNCYDGMPDAVELAIGWVRTSARLAALTRTPSAMEVTERLLLEAVKQRRLGGQAALPAFTGFTEAATTTRPCGGEPKALAAMTALGTPQPGVDPRPLHRIASNDGAALAALGLAPRVRPAMAATGELPPLRLDGAADARTPMATAAGTVFPSLDPAEAAALRLVPAPAATVCRTPT